MPANRGVAVRRRGLSSTRNVAIVALTVLALAASGLAADEGEPLLRLEAGGPTSYVTALAFSPDGKTLYAGSWDKTVYMWRWDEAGRQFRLDPASWRVPIGPGLQGAVNAIAVSTDGNWLAVAGSAAMRGASDYRRPGWILPTLGGLTDAMREDQGVISVFDTRTRTTTTLRGHRGEVRALAFAPSEPESPLLVSAAREQDAGSDQKRGVVRVWDVLGKESQPKRQALPVPQTEFWGVSPKLAVRRHAQEPLALDVAIAWGDGVFRVWDVERDQVFSAAQQGEYLDTVIYHQGLDRFVMGAVGSRSSALPLGTLLRSWKPGPANAWELDGAHSFERQRPADSTLVPRDMTLIAAAPGGAPGMLSAIMHRTFGPQNQRDQYELWLIKPPLGGVEPQRISLWAADTSRRPLLAAAPGGRHLAVTKGSEVYVLEIGELLANRPRPQILQSAGTTFGEVAFVRKGGARGPLGLRLKERRREAAAAAVGADLIFDFERKALLDSASAGNWMPANSPPPLWRVESVPSATGQKWTRLVFQAGRRRGTVELPPKYTLTSYALASNAKRGVMAIAATEAGMPVLLLYDVSAGAGQQIRQLTSHTGPIRSLAFSDDGDLLASAAEDETTCLWRLTDLDQIVGRRGKATGVAIRQTARGLEAQIDDAEKATARLHDGDVVLGRVRDNRLEAWASPREFYDAFSFAAPGETIQVRRRGQSGAEDDVAVPVGQGVDERKPLFSLFVTHSAAGQSDAAGQKRGWIGWSPLGPYEASDKEVEHCLGWQFNTGRPENPVTFALAPQYRKTYYRPGLLDALIKSGEPPRIPEAPILHPQMDLTIVADDGDFAEPTGDGLLRKPPVKASLIIADLPADTIDKIELNRDGQALGTLSRQPDGVTWSGSLDPAAQQPGEHTLQAVVHTREAVPQQFSMERLVRYQLPPPVVTVATPRGGVSGQVVDQKEFDFEATVEPATAGTTVEVALRRRHAGEEAIVKQWKTNQRLEIKERVVLGLGGNVITLMARNQDALAGHEATETSQQYRTVNYVTEALPLIASDARVVELPADQPGRPVDLDAGAAVVTADKIEVSIDVAGITEPTTIEIGFGDKTVDVPVMPPSSGRATVKAVIEPPLGPTMLSLRKKGAGAPAIETRIGIERRRPLPDLTVDRPEPEQVLVAGRDPPAVDLLARLLGVIDPTLQAVLLVNGKPAANAPVIDRQARTLAARVPLEPGQNDIAVRLFDADNDPQEKRIATVNYLSLPTVERFEVASDQTPVADVVVSGKSATPVTRLEVDGDRQPTSDIQYDQAAGVWRSTIHVPRRPQPYEIAVQVRNGDGQLLAPGRWQVPAWKEIGPPPTIELPSDSSVTGAQFEVPVVIRSASPLRSVDIQQNRNAGLVNFAPRLAALAPDAAGSYTLRESVVRKLLPGPNRIEVSASNDGGSTTAEFTVNYIDPAVRIVIDGMEMMGAGASVKRQLTATNSQIVVFQSAPGPRVKISGHVVWPQSMDSDFLRRPQRVQSFVNGFQQAVLEVEPPDREKRESKFVTLVVLNKKHDNRIQINLPDLPKDLGTEQELRVDCDDPVHEQRLHLLVIGVGAPRNSEQRLKEEVLTALKAMQSSRGNVWRTAAFDQVLIYPAVLDALVGDISPPQVRGQLVNIKRKIEELHRARPANDVVMIYLQGGTLINTDSEFYVTTRRPGHAFMERALRDREPRMLREVAVRGGELADLLTHTAGAHLLMLDVKGDSAAEKDVPWPNDSQAAILRYTWLKGEAAPAKARLLAALPEAIGSPPGQLAQLDAKIARFYSQLSAAFPGSIVYEGRVPGSLQGLLIGEP